VSKPTVSTATVVKEGKHSYYFDLSSDKLEIRYRYSNRRAPKEAHITLSSFALGELRRMLGATPSPIDTALPIERPPDLLPKEGLQGKETEDGLIRTEEGIVSGMEQ